MSVEKEEDMPSEVNFLDDGDLIDRPPTDPKAFVPTLQKPLPNFPCTAITRKGERCTNSAIMGMRPENALCSSHGGGNPLTRDAAAARCEAARLMLFDNVEMAAETLRALMDPGVSEAVRLKAAVENLDRTIGKTPIDLNINQEVTVSAGDDIRAMLESLIENKYINEDEDEDDIPDAEIVE